MRIVKTVSGLLLFFSILFAPFNILSIKANGKTTFFNYSETDRVYRELMLDEYGLPREVFERAVQGYSNLVSSGKVMDTGILSIADFSQPSINKRLYIINIKTHTLLFNTWVAHGKNTGDLVAQKFSNSPQSLQSSLGFYITGSTYQGKHGISLQLHGMEPGINDNALERAIVMHGADYVNDDFIRSTGRLGRSFGCPAVDSKIAQPIITAIEGGNVLFIYHNNPGYLASSSVINQ